MGLLPSYCFRLRGDLLHLNLCVLKARIDENLGGGGDGCLFVLGSFLGLAIILGLTPGALFLQGHSSGSDGSSEGVLPRDLLLTGGSLSTGALLLTGDLPGVLPGHLPPLLRDLLPLLELCLVISFLCFEIFSLWACAVLGDLLRGTIWACAVLLSPSGGEELHGALWARAVLHDTVLDLLRETLWALSPGVFLGVMIVC